jgi:hypothetical protein
MPRLPRQAIILVLLAIVTTGCGRSHQPTPKSAASASSAPATSQPPASSATTAPTWWPATTSTPTWPTTTAPTATTARPAQPRAAETTAALRILRIGGSHLQDEAGLQRSYALVLHNQSPLMAVDVQVAVTFADANRSALDTTTETIPYILPGQTTAIAGVDSADAREQRVEGAVTHARWAASPFTGTIEVSGVHTDVNADLTLVPVDTEVSLHSTLPVDIPGVTITAVYFNAAGKIIGGDEGCIDLTSGEEAVGSVEPPILIRGIARTQVYWYLNATSEDGRPC